MTIELPACAAIRLLRTEHGGSVEIVLAGKRHGDCFRMLAAIGLYKLDAKQGFVTTRGRFVDRHAAYLMMQEAGLPSAAADGYRGVELFSEDLY